MYIYLFTIGLKPCPHFFFFFFFSCFYPVSLSILFHKIWNPIQQNQTHIHSHIHTHKHRHNTHTHTHTHTLYIHHLIQSTSLLHFLLLPLSLTLNQEKSTKPNQKNQTHP